MNGAQMQNHVACKRRQNEAHEQCWNMFTHALIETPTEPDQIQRTSARHAGTPVYRKRTRSLGRWSVSVPRSLLRFPYRTPKSYLIAIRPKLSRYSPASRSAWGVTV